MNENVAGRAARQGNESWPGATRHDAVSLCLVFFWTLGVCCDSWPVPPGFCGALVGPIAVFVATAACCGACSTIRVRAKSCGGALSLASRGRIPVIAGAGANATARAIELTRDAEAAGADAILSVVPYYNKPTQAGLYAHFREITKSTGLPIILYDVPSRTACGLADETVARLAELPRVIGLKDAAGDATRPARLRPLVGTDFRLLSGDDALALAYFAHGGDGCISVTSNVAPGLCRAMFLAWKHGQSVRAQRLARPLAQLTAALFRETNPVPVKHALALLGLMSPAVRLPLVELSDQARAELGEVLLRLCDEYADCMIGRVGKFGEARPRLAATG